MSSAAGSIGQVESQMAGQPGTIRCDQERDTNALA